MAMGNKLATVAHVTLAIPLGDGTRMVDFLNIVPQYGKLVGLTGAHEGDPPNGQHLTAADAIMHPAGIPRSKGRGGMRKRILAIMQEHPTKTFMIDDFSNVTDDQKTISTTLKYMRVNKLIRSTSRGHYQLTPAGKKAA